MVAIDKKGTVTFAQAGMLPQSYLEKLIAEMEK
jgi:predicted transcriptional regulator